METCIIDHSDHKNNGLITKVWGEPTWTSNHAITFGYPIKPTEQQKKEYKDYFISLGNVLPCRYCRESYREFITTGDTALNNDVLKGRDTLTEWFYRVHDSVNKKLEIEYAVTYGDIVDKYESFRAKCGPAKSTVKGCVAPLDYKAMSFKKLYYHDCPVVPLEIIKPFVELAKIRGVDELYFSFMDLAIKLNGDFNKLKKQESWPYRNKYCFKIIKKMRINGTPSIEQSGKWAGTPTIDELRLMMFLSSNLNKTELAEATKALMANVNYNKL